MLEVSTIIVCRDCRVSWGENDQPVCNAADHTHGPFEVHRHQSPVDLPGRTRITAVSFYEAAPYEREAMPDFGLYLDHRWEPPWPHAHVDWPDFGVPEDQTLLKFVLSDLLGRARAGQQVEIGCLGAHGRTGTALACLAVLAGVESERAVKWVRTHYCQKAVETPQQEAFIRDFVPA